MSIAIRYFTKSKKGNTEKIAKFISEKLNLEAKTIEDNLNESVDTLL